MTIKIEKFNISSNGFNDFIDITARIQGIIASLNINEALVNISTPASTASIITFEAQNGLKGDLVRLLDEIVPINKVYLRDSNWHEGNALSHLKAAFLGNNITLSVIDGVLVLEQYQSVILADFDLKPQIRTIIVTITY